MSVLRLQGRRQQSADHQKQFRFSSRSGTFGSSSVLVDRKRSAGPA
jgi:hypothetical protein